MGQCILLGQFGASSPKCEGLYSKGGDESSNGSYKVTKDYKRLAVIRSVDANGYWNLRILRNGSDVKTNTFRLFSAVDVVDEGLGSSTVISFLDDVKKDEIISVKYGTYSNHAGIYIIDIS